LYNTGHIIKYFAGRNTMKYFIVVDRKDKEPIIIKENNKIKLFDEKREILQYISTNLIEYQDSIHIFPLKED